MATVISPMQIYCTTKEAFAALTGAECFIMKNIKDVFVANIFSFEYTVVLTGIHTTYNIPVVLSVLVGRAYANDTNAMRDLAQKQDDLMEYFKDNLTEKTFTDDTMVTTGEGFSTTETQIRP